jgi:hypothetical protein
MLRLALSSPEIRTIVFSARWTNWRIGQPANPSEPAADVRLRDSYGLAGSTLANSEKWKRGFFDLIDRLSATHKRIVIVGPLPEPTFNVPHSLYVERFGFSKPVEPITVAQYRQRHRAILRIFEELAANKNVVFVWPQRVLCSVDKCPVVDRGGPIFFDHNHLSIYGAGKTSRLYDFIFEIR